jgi:hypothetical protein
MLGGDWINPKKMPSPWLGGDSGASEEGLDNAEEKISPVRRNMVREEEG